MDLDDRDSIIVYNPPRTRINLFFLWNEKHNKIDLISDDVGIFLTNHDFSFTAPHNAKRSNIVPIGNLLPALSLVSNLSQCISLNKLLVEPRRRFRLILIMDI
jgi:hypothetical protein